MRGKVGRVWRGAIGLLLVAAHAAAFTGPEILERRKELDETTRRWSDRERHIVLRLEHPGGEQRREMTTYERQLPGGREQAILFFQAPASIRGLGLLSYSQPGRADEQWVYLPALKKIRQINASRADRSDRFASTDLTFHDLDLLRDMTKWTEADAPSVLLGEDDVVDGVATYRIERTPTQSDVYYRRIVLWLGKDDLVTRRVEFFDAAPTPVKRIDESQVRTVDGIPVAHRLEAVTLPGGSRTVMDVAQLRFNQQLGDALFTQRTLQRGRP